ncbi:Hercynylcysteine sulfoxide lyase [Spathaspora sp. JA1]|nr:Hercynylcysteine sulfoxide lyase [Spathaspora sp. JA1]
MTGPIVPFGKQFRKQYFSSIDPEVFPVNHGSWGQLPDPLLEKFKQASGEQYSYTDKFFHDIRYKYIDALKKLSPVLNCDYHNLALVDNATTGVNTILRSYPFKKGDKIVVQSNVYGACANVVKFLQYRYGIEFIEIEVSYPTSDDEILTKFEKVFQQHKPRLCLFDTISSMPGVIFPFIQMVKLCKTYDVVSLIDGAHGIGCIPQDLSEISPDFYVSNLHKWYFVPTACAVMYVDPKHHNNIHTMPISHSYLQDDVELSEEKQLDRLIDRFNFIGAKNYASVAVIADSIKFRNEICGGEEVIFKYCHDLAKQVGSVISKKWGTSYLEQEQGPSLISTMVNVEIPTDSLGIDVNGIKNNWTRFDQEVYTKLIDVHKAFTPCVVHNGKLYARFSCQIYNELSDYEHAADVLVKVMKESVDLEPLFKSLKI